MKWITREHAKVDRVACPWLIRRFIDSDAQFLFVPAPRVLALAEREGAHSYDAPGAKYTHRDGKCSFEVLIEAYRLKDPALDRMARIVHGADVPEDLAICPEAAGLRAIAEGFSVTTPDDHAKLEAEFALYDALYAWCQKEVAVGA
jgi:hypothetical protein